MSNYCLEHAKCPGSRLINAVDRMQWNEERANEGGTLDNHRSTERHETPPLFNQKQLKALGVIVHVVDTNRSRKSATPTFRERYFCSIDRALAK